MSKPEELEGYLPWNICQQFADLSLEELKDVKRACDNLIHYRETIEKQILGKITPKDVEPDYYNKEGF